MNLLRQRAGALRPRWWTRSTWGLVVAVALAVGVFGLLQLDVVLAGPVDAVVQSCGTDVVDGGLRSPDTTYIRCALLVDEGGQATEESVPVFAAQPAGSHITLVRTIAFGLQDLRLDDGGGWPALPVAAVLLAAAWWMGFPTPVSGPGRHARRVTGDRYRDERARAHPGEPVSDDEIRRLQAVLLGETVVSASRTDKRARRDPWVGVAAIGVGLTGVLTDHSDGVPWAALLPLVSGLVLLCCSLAERRRHTRESSET